MRQEDNPYLKENRLGDVIAAITTLGLYKFYKISFVGWADRITGSKEDVDRWRSVFEDHPEFFRINPERDKASLVWRRQLPRLYDVDLGESVDPAMSAEEKAKRRLSRNPLTPSEVSALVSLAVEMHERALEQSKASRWWIPVATGILAFIGTLSAAAIGASWP